MIPYIYQISKISKSTDTESRLVVASGLGEERMLERLLMGFLLEWWKCSKQTGMMAVQL